MVTSAGVNDGSTVHYMLVVAWESCFLYAGHSDIVPGQLVNKSLLETIAIEGKYVPGSEANCVAQVRGRIPMAGLHPRGAVPGGA